MIFNQTGGTSLNFKVVKNPQPANPSENTIWVNTDQKITGSYFQSTQPEDMAEGEVWISTGTSSQVAFNAAKKGVIMIYPLSAKQMVSGTLVDVPAKIWQDGEWVDLIRYLYNKGNIYEEITGGWDTNTYGGATVKFNDSSVRFTAANTGQPCRATMRTKNKIDVTNVKTLRAHVISATARNDGYMSQKIGLCDSTEFLYANPQERVALKECDIGGSDFFIDIDVSEIEGSHYAFFVGGDGNTSSVYTEIDKIEVLYEQDLADQAELEAAYDYLLYGGAV